tara:strand:+ start:727 stop:1344 length:618 start_codon:yes stop_codon:yes gene_type:complete
MENTENKSLKSFFLSNKKKLFLLIGVIFFSLIYFWWADHTKKKDRYKNSEDFIAAKIFLSNNENQKSLEVLKKIISTNDEVYSPLSLFMIIDRNLEENRENVLKYFDQIISINSLEKEDLNLLKLKKAIYISDSADETDLLKMLNPILNSESVWKYKSLKLLGDYYFNKKEYIKAKQYYSKILTLEDPSIDLSYINRKIKIIEND